ncbi:MAG: hypothetical protein WAM63_05535, partial [Rhodomicrobium sp.]
AKNIPKRSYHKATSSVGGFAKESDLPALSPRMGCGSLNHPVAPEATGPLQLTIAGTGRWQIPRTRDLCIPVFGCIREHLA